MKIYVCFDNEWTVEDIKEFIATPDAEKFTSMNDDMYLELVACAECYATGVYNHQDPDDYEMRDEAERSIASGIENHFFDDMIDGYFDYYITNVAFHLPESENRDFARKMGIDLPEGDTIVTWPCDSRVCRTTQKS